MTPALGSASSTETQTSETVHMPHSGRKIKPLQSYGRNFIYKNENIFYTAISFPGASVPAPGNGSLLHIGNMTFMYYL